MDSLLAYRSLAREGLVLTAHGESVRFDGLQFVLPPEAVAEIVAQIKREVLAELAPDDAEWLTVEQAAAYLGRSPQAVYSLRHRGELRCRKAAGRLLFNHAELRAFIETSPERS